MKALKKLKSTIKWHKDAIQNGGVSVWDCIAIEVGYFFWKLRKK